MGDRNYLLFGVFIFILLILSSEISANQSEPNGHLHLSMYDTYGVGVYTSVILRDTLGNKTEMSLEGLGEYSFSATPGYYCLIIPVVDMQPMLTRRWLYLAAGDTVRVYQEFERVCGSGDDWLVSDPENIRKLTVEFSDSGNHDLNGLTLYSRHTCYRVNRISNDTYEAYIDITHYPMYWNLPFLGDRIFQLPYNVLFSGAEATLNLDISLDSSIDSINASDVDPGITDLHATITDEWVSPDYTVHRELVDPADYGFEDLRNYGYVDGRAYFDQTEEGETWRIILAFNKKIVVLIEGFEPIEYDLDAAIYRVDFSPRGRFLFLSDASEDIHSRDHAILLDTVNGEVRRFRNETKESQDYSTTGRQNSVCIITVSQMWSYHPADDGTIVSLYTDSMKYFNEQLELTNVRSYNGVRFLDGHNRVRLRSSDGSRFFAKGIFNEECTLFQINREGFVEYSEPMLGPVYLGNFKADSSLTVLAATANNYGISVWNLSDGSLQWHLEADQCGGTAVSPDGNLIGWSPGWIDCEIRSAAIGELIDTFTSGTSFTSLFKIGILNDDGTILLDGHSHEGARIALRSNSGEFVWINAKRLAHDRSAFRTGGTYMSQSSIRDLRALSSDGSRLIYNDGCFIHILGFERSAR